MKGKVTLRVLNAKTGKQVLAVHSPNTVVTAAAEPMCKLLGGDADAPNLFAQKMAFGTGTVTPATTDVALQRAITPVKDITSVSYPSDTSVLFIGNLLADEGNGFPINEVGLLNANKVLMARTVLAAPQPKTVDYIFQFEWLIEL